jgi:tRNA-dihydrouridine synthase 1
MGGWYRCVPASPDEAAANMILTSSEKADLNLGCPQEHAIEGHYGAYMLGRKDWPLIEQIGMSYYSVSARFLIATVSALSASLDVPVSTKLRLCTPSALTPVLAERICAAGASFITLHARYPSARRRRHGPAELSVVKALVEDEKVPVPVISNGNVRTWSDIEANLEYTKAKGVMVGEALLTNPWSVDVSGSCYV